MKTDKGPKAQQAGAQNTGENNTQNMGMAHENTQNMGMYEKLSSLSEDEVLERLFHEFAEASVIYTGGRRGRQSLSLEKLFQNFVKTLSANSRNYFCKKLLDTEFSDYLRQKLSGIDIYATKYEELRAKIASILLTYAAKNKYQWIFGYSQKLYLDIAGTILQKLRHSE